MTGRSSPWIRSFRMISQGQFLDDLFIRVHTRVDDRPNNLKGPTLSRVHRHTCARRRDARKT